ncbi:MAG: pilin [Gammaproteobacteria bacterium]|nr:pilin [Gammaproteobacteria bacterium]
MDKRSQCKTPAHRSVAMSSRGFTIIELMIVVTVISVLMVIAIPIYQSYTARAQLSEGLNLAAGIKQRIGEIKTFQGAIPPVDPANVAMGLAPPESYSGQYVSAIRVRPSDTCQPTSEPITCYPADGTIEVEYKFSSAFSGRRIHGIQPFFLTGSIKWDCASDADPVANSNANDHVPVQFRPPVCRP